MISVHVVTSIEMIYFSASHSLYCKLPNARNCLIPLLRLALISAQVIMYQHVISI